MLKGRIHREQTHVGMRKLGNIKCGEKTEKGHPTSLDHFVADGIYKHLFDQAFGEKPQKIEIVFATDDVEAVNERYELRTSKDFDGIGGRLFAESDGMTFDVFDKDKNIMVEQQCETEAEAIKLMEKLAAKVKGEWNHRLTLKFFIPRIKGVFGPWQLTTGGSASSVPTILKTLDTLKEQAGTFAGIPIDLIVEKVKSQKPGSKSNFPVLSMVPNISHENLEIIRDMIESGQKLRSVITDESIAQIAESHKQLEYDPGQAALNAIKETFHGTEVHSDMTMEQAYSVLDEASKEGKATFLVVMKQVYSDHAWTKTESGVLRKFCEEQMQRWK